MTTASATAITPRDGGLPRLPLFEPPGACLYWLSNSISALRVAATWTLARELPVGAGVELLLDVFRAEWAALGEEGPERVVHLAQALREEYSLVAAEFMAYALAVQGEDGATELAGLLTHHDSSVRSKAVIGLSMLGSSARWAVPLLARRLVEEESGFVQTTIIRALGSIGGRRAEDTLERVVSLAGDALAAPARASLASIRSPDHSEVVAVISENSKRPVNYTVNTPAVMPSYKQKRMTWPRLTLLWHCIVSICESWDLEDDEVHEPRGKMNVLKLSCAFPAVLGKTIAHVVMVSRPTQSPQLYFVFTDDTHYELYNADSLTGCRRVSDGGLDAVRRLARDTTYVTEICSNGK